MTDQLHDNAPPAVLSAAQQIDALAAAVDLPSPEEGWNFGLPQLFLLVLASAVLFATCRAFGWGHVLCNGPLFLLVASLAKGRRVEALCLELLLFSGMLWGLSFFGIL